MYGIKFFILLIMSIIGVCSCHTKEDISFSDQTIISEVFSSLSDQIFKRDYNNISQLLMPNFLHQGSTLSEVKLQLNELATIHQTRLNFKQLDIAINQDEAVADYLLEVEDCDINDEGESICRTIKRCYSQASDSFCSQWRYLQYIDGYWWFTGDQKKQSIQLYISHDEDGIFLDGSIRSFQQNILEVKAKWDNQKPITFEKKNDRYWSPMNTELPNDYTLYNLKSWSIYIEIQYIDFKEQIEYKIYGVNSLFVNDFQPLGEVLPPIEFSWNLINLNAFAGSYIQVLKDERIYWKSPITFINKIKYAGPNLLSGEQLIVEQVNQDLYGNIAKSRYDLQVIDESDLTPEIRAITPNQGSIFGETQITIRGNHFLEGINVLIGTQNALNINRVSSTELTCYTPSSIEGFTNVIVINPSGKSGVLEKAFQYIPQ